MQIRIEVNPSYIDCEQLISLLAASGWGKKDDYTEGKIEKMMEGCSHFIVACENDFIVGYGRALSDDILVTWISEILVHPDHRAKGIGRKIMRELLQSTMHTSIYTQAFVGTEGFFEKFGITMKQKLIACSRKPLIASKT